VQIDCQTTGEPVEGNAIYNRLLDGTYLPDRYTYTGIDGFDPRLPRCQDPGAEQPQPAEPQPFGAPCAPSIVLAVPGSHETHVGNDPARAHGLLADATDTISMQLGLQVRVHYVDYPAKLYNDNNLPDLGLYFASKDQGYSAAWSALNTYARDCPNSRFALLGYSQGAHIIGDLAATIGNEASPVAPDRVEDVMLVADPVRNPIHPVHGSGWAGHGALGIRGSFGALTTVTELCVKNDIVCSANGFSGIDLVINGFTSPAHSSYTTAHLEGRTFTQHIAALLSSNLR
jgi:hypothetical protein